MPGKLFMASISIGSTEKVSGSETMIELSLRDSSSHRVYVNRPDDFLTHYRALM